ncbi:trypsin-like serine protease, partial [Pyrenophora tritici-repentis]
MRFGWAKTSYSKRNPLLSTDWSAKASFTLATTGASIETTSDILNVVKPIALPTEEPKLGSTCLASGWGSTTPFKFQNAKDLQCVNLKLLPNEDCDKAHEMKVTDAMLCAGEMDGGSYTCE